MVNSKTVVNCFQNLYLWLSETANYIWWLFRLSCELLSKFVSLTFRNSRVDGGRYGENVVNCFQNLYLWLSETAIQNFVYITSALWIAFKICIFDFQKQQRMARLAKCRSCELLSKFVSLTFRNSCLLQQVQSCIVVNCFQNLYLWLSETAKTNLQTWNGLLWIAFKICIFDFQKQRMPLQNQRNTCCELLSKFVSLTFRNSNRVG